MEKDVSKHFTQSVKSRNFPMIPHLSTTDVPFLSASQGQCSVFSFFHLLCLLFCVSVGKILKMAFGNWLLTLSTDGCLCRKRSCLSSVCSSRREITPSEKVKCSLSVQSGGGACFCGGFGVGFLLWLVGWVSVRFF